jgi:hypothetical protein
MEGLWDLGEDNILSAKLNLSGLFDRYCVFYIPQNEESCVVFGMPKEAIKLGAAEKVLNIRDVAKTALELLA